MVPDQGVAVSKGRHTPRFDRAAIVRAVEWCLLEEANGPLTFRDARDVRRALELAGQPRVNLRTLQHRLALCCAEGLLERSPGGGWTVTDTNGAR